MGSAPNAQEVKRRPISRMAQLTLWLAETSNNASELLLSGCLQCELQDCPLLAALQISSFFKKNILKKQDTINTYNI